MSETVVNKKEKTSVKKKHRAVRVIVTVVLSLLIAVYVLLPVGMGIFASTRGEQASETPPEGFEAVTLTASDGVALAAWYAPSENGAAILLVHGSTGNLSSVRGYADMLRGHGYGVLALTLRGHGGSGGGGNALGWECGRDIGAAAEYLSVQEGVESIGAMGLSLGGEVLLVAVGEHPEIKAVVSDGATHHTLADYLTLPSNRSLWRSWTTRVMYFSTGLFTGQQPPETSILNSVKAAQDTQLMLIAAGTVEDEASYGQMYAEAAGERAQLWVVPEAGHTQAFALYPDEYAQRVTDFFGAVLLMD